MTTEFSNFWGGIAAYCHTLCRALGNRVEFHVFTASRKRVQTRANGRDNGLKVSVHPISLGGDISFSIICYQFNLVHKLPKLIREYNLDLVHSAGPLADQLLRIIGHRIPHVLTYHSTLSGQKLGISDSGIRFKELDISEKLTMVTYPFLKQYESLSLARTGNIIAVSEAVRKELIESYGYKRRITVIPNGVDPDVFQPNRKGGRKRRVLFSGRLVAIKGLHFLIRAMPHVLKKHKEVIFVFAGVGERRPYLRMLQELNIPDKNFEFSYVSYHDMPQFYNSGDMLVLPSLLESFSMSILEAMACGLPVIASNVGDTSKLVKDGLTGFLTRKGDCKALADNINLLLDDEDLRKKMSRDARDLVVQNYSAEMMGHKTLEVYHQVVEDGA